MAAASAPFHSTPFGDLVSLKNMSERDLEQEPLLYEQRVDEGSSVEQEFAAVQDWTPPTPPESIHEAQAD